MGALLKSKLFIAVVIVAALIGLYALLGFKVAPGFVHNKAIEYVRAEYGREIAIGEIRIHPFKLQFEARDISFPDADGERMLGLARLFLDFELSSLWKRALYFREVDLDSPYVRAMIRPDGAMNLGDLAPRTAPAEDEEDEEPTKVWIADLQVADGVVDYVDRARSQPFERRFAPVTFALRDFKTTPEGGDFHLSARSQADEKFEWKGRFALAPVVSSDGEFTIADLRAVGVDEFLGDALNYNLTGGLIDLGGQYRLALGETTELDLTLPKIELDALTLRAPGVDEDWIRAPSVVVSDVKASMPAQTVAIGGVTATEVTVQAWLDQDGSVNLERLFAPSVRGVDDADAGQAVAPAPSAPVQPAPIRPVAPPSTAAAPVGSADPAPAQAPEAGNDWTVTLGSVELKDARIDFEDRSVTPAAKFALAPVDAKLTKLSLLDQSRPVPVEVTARLDGDTPIKAAGTLVFEPFAAELDIELDALDLSRFQPYVGQATDMTIRRGKARAAGKFSLSPPGSKTPELAFAGDVRVSGFRSIDDALEEDFINFDRLDLRKLRFAMQPDALSIDRVVLRKPYARVSISPDQVLNVAAVFDPEGTAAALAERKAQAAEQAAAESAAKERQAASVKETEEKEGGACASSAARRAGGDGLADPNPRGEH